MTENERILQQAVEEEARRQGAALVIDFDQAFEEEKQKAIVVKWRGKEYKVPATPPEWFHLMTLRNEGNFSDQENDIVIRRLFGDEFADQMNEAGKRDNWLNMRMVNEKLIAPIIKKWYGEKLVDTTKKK